MSRRLNQTPYNKWRNSSKYKWKKRGTPSGTTGKSKGGNCIATALDKFFAKYSRGARHSGYINWCKSHK